MVRDHGGDREVEPIGTSRFSRTEPRFQGSNFVRRTRALEEAQSFEREDWITFVENLDP